MSELIDRAKAFYRDILTDPQASAREYLADGFVLENHLPEHFPFGGCYQGVEGFLRYLTELTQAIEMGPLEMDEWVADGRSVVARGSEGSLVHSTGRRYHMRFVHWLTFDEDGKIVSMREFNDTAEMARAFDA